MNVQKKIVIAFIRAKLNGLALLNYKKAGEEAFDLFCTPPSRSKKQSEVFKKAEHLSFTSHGLRVTGFRFNQSGKEKVMILHGFSSSSQHFEAYVQPLIDKNYEVLAFDAPAHGASEGNRINALEYSEIIEEIQEQFGPITKFIAHSFGGLAISLALERMPHDHNTRVALIAPATETTSAIEHAFMMLGLTNPLLRKAMEDTIKAKSGKDASWFSIRRAMHQIKANILWLHDEEDDTTPLKDALQVQADQHPNVQFIISKGLGHRKIYRDAGVQKAIIDFI